MQKSFHLVTALLLGTCLCPPLVRAQDVVQQDNASINKKTPVAPPISSSATAASAAPAGYVSPYYNYDDDKDGVPNGRDKCPNTPGGEKVTPFGCPYDTDFDGVYDYEDQCDTEAGPRENLGCPYGDKDSDGVKDNIDKCPDVPGPLRLAGCPDTDDDGITDALDACPKVAGLREYNGCPPNKKDTDGDGVYDFEDLCVHTPGVRANRGCPELKEEEKKALKKAFSNLLFETNKDVIKGSSFASLNELAQVLKGNPAAQLTLEGHTDNVGEEAANQALSENRAAAVKRYLASKGVAESRVTTAGFGESKPLGTNDDDKGRAQNRRVEMNIKYE